MLYGIPEATGHLMVTPFDWEQALFVLCACACMRQDSLSGSACMRLHVPGLLLLCTTVSLRLGALTFCAAAHACGGAFLLFCAPSHPCAAASVGSERLCMHVPGPS